MHLIGKNGTLSFEIETINGKEVEADVKVDTRQ